MKSTGFAIVLFIAACVTPQPPGPTHPPAPDRYQRVASPDPAARAAAVDEFVFDPTPEAVRMLLVVLERDVDPKVRGAAAAAIAERRDPTLEPALERAATVDPDPQTRQAAADARVRLHPWSKRPGRAAAFGLLCPGCGHLYLGDTTEGAAYLGTGAALVGGAYLSLRGHQVSLDGASDSASVPVGLLLATTGQNLWFYSIFDAYRTARARRESGRAGGDSAGYRFAISRESLGELASAPFRPGVIKSPWVWAGVPLALALGIGVSYLAAPDDLSQSGAPSIFDVREVNVFGHRFSRGPGFAAGTGYFAALFGSVGVGEEALFRGVIQTELEERFGPTGGLIAASVLFGSIHALNFLDDPGTIAVAVPVITVLGSSLGLAYQHTGHELSTSVAMHFWYDFLLSTIAFAADPTHQPFVVEFSSPL